MLRYAHSSSAPPAAAWSLLARPDRWPEWAPHLRGAWGLGSPEVVTGRTGAARLLGVVPVPARIVAKQPGRSWEWQVGPVRMDHRVEPDGDGCRVVVEMRAAAPVEAALALTYGPLVDLLVRNCARAAERHAGRTAR
jgi:hypothetical protein